MVPWRLRLRLPLCWQGPRRSCNVPVFSLPPRRVAKICAGIGARLFNKGPPIVVQGTSACIQERDTHKHHAQSMLKQRLARCTSCQAETLQSPCHT